MAFEQKDNSGAIFKNDKREKDTHPHGTGSAMINGVEYWVSAWTKDGKNGNFQSLAFKRKEDKTKSTDYSEHHGGARDSKNPSYVTDKSATKNNFDNFDDDIPF